MTKQPTQKSATARIRFIMLDAELPEGDLSQITSAIQNALKPTTTIIQQRLPPQLPAVLPSGLKGSEAEAEAEPELVDPDDDTSPEDAAARPTRDPRPATSKTERTEGHRV